MSGQVLVGEGRDIRSVADDDFVNAVKHLPERMVKRLAFMSHDHHTVRDFVVREMPRQQQPLTPRQIASVTAIDSRHVSTILSELEEHLFFLVRNSEGNVTWAFPVTTEQTAHRLSFSTGERICGAWAEDAFATSFVQGRLRGEKLSVRIDSECKHCSRPLVIEVNEELAWKVVSADATPLVFEPDVNWNEFSGANIIHDYWNQTVFFWSEEHARKYRQINRQSNGVYLTMDQMAFSERIAQSGLFAISPNGQLRR